MQGVERFPKKVVKDRSNSVEFPPSAVVLKMHSYFLPYNYSFESYRSPISTIVSIIKLEGGTHGQNM